MPALLTKGGIVCISAYIGDNADSLWRRKGFKVRYGYVGLWNTQFYIYGDMEG